MLTTERTARPATVTINVLPAAPVAAPQSVSVSYNTATPITLSATGTGTLTYTVLTTPTHGALSGAAPNLTYTPTSGYVGPDSFTFKANNQVDSAPATVTINVLPLAPVANAQSVTVSFNSTRPGNYVERNRCGHADLQHRNPAGAWNPERYRPEPHLHANHWLRRSR